MAFQDESPIWGPVYRIEQPDQVLGGIPDRMTGGGKSNWPHEDLARRTAYLKQGLDYLSLDAAVEVTVGAGGDFATINAALAELSSRRQSYVPGGITATIRLLTGFIMAEQVRVSGINLGWISIVGDDASTTIDRAYLTDQVPGGGGYAAFSAIDSGVLPTIRQLFSMNTAADGTDRHGICLLNGASATVGTGCGVQNAGGHGARVATASRLIAASADFRNAEVHGIWASGGSSVVCASAYLRDCGSVGIYATGASLIQAQDADARGCATSGVTASQASTINATNVYARMGGANGASDIRVSASGIVEATGAVGGTNVTTGTWTTSGWIGR